MIREVGPTELVIGNENDESESFRRDYSDGFQRFPKLEGCNIA